MHSHTNTNNSGTSTTSHIDPTAHAKQNQLSYHRFWAEHDKLDLCHSTKFLAVRDLFQLIDQHLLQAQPKTSYKILDFGCGNGEIAQLVSEMFSGLGLQIELHCLDKNQKNLEAARKRNPKATFHEMDESTFATALKDFDLILCNFVLLENELPAMQKILENIQRALNDNGIAIITHNTAKVYDEENNWVSFNTKFDENKRNVFDARKQKHTRRDGKPVYKEMLDENGKATFKFHDFFYRRCTYKSAFIAANLTLIASHKPLGKKEETIAWKYETSVAPYRLDILRKSPSADLQLTARPCV